MLGVDLCETEDLAIRERASVLLLYLVEVGDLLGREGEALLLVELLEVVHALDGLGVVVDGEDLLVQTVIHALEHRVVVGLGRIYGEILLYAADSLQGHVLRDLYRVGAPRRDHLAPGAYEISLQLIIIYRLGIAVKPTKFAYLFFGKLVICLRGNHALRPCPEKKNHNLSSKLGNNGAKITINAHMAK